MFLFAVIWVAHLLYKVSLRKVINVNNTFSECYLPNVSLNFWKYTVLSIVIVNYYSTAFISSSLPFLKYKTFTYSTSPLSQLQSTKVLVYLVLYLAWLISPHYPGCIQCVWSLLFYHSCLNSQNLVSLKPFISTLPSRSRNILVFYKIVSNDDKISNWNLQHPYAHT